MSRATPPHQQKPPQPGFELQLRARMNNHGKFNISEVPLEIFREILMRAVQVRDVKRALRLGLVNKLFAAELLEALVAARALDEVNVKAADINLARSYLTMRILEDQTTAYPKLNRIREVAKRLAAEDGDPSKCREYTIYLASEAIKGAKPMSEFFNVFECRGEFEFDVLAAAAITNHLSLVENLTPLYMRLGFSTFGNPGYESIRKGNLEALDLIVAGKWEMQPSLKLHLLHHACRNGDIRVVEHILNASWNPYKDDHNNRSTELESILKTPSVQVFQGNMTEREKLGRPLKEDHLVGVLCHAAPAGWTEMVQHLISLGAPLEEDWWSWDLYPKPPLYRACESGFDETAKVLLENGAQISGRELLVAAQHGHSRTIRLLLNNGANVVCTESKDALSVAARGGYFQAIRLLLDHGMDANQGSPPPIVQAIESENVALFELLLERGADLNIPEVGAAAMKKARDAGLDSMLALLKRTMREEEWKEASMAS